MPSRLFSTSQRHVYIGSGGRARRAGLVDHGRFAIALCRLCAACRPIQAGRLRAIADAGARAAASLRALGGRGRRAGLRGRAGCSVVPRGLTAG